MTDSIAEVPRKKPVGPMKQLVEEMNFEIHVLRKQLAYVSKMTGNTRAVDGIRREEENGRISLQRAHEMIAQAEGNG
jgi:hypothetical protein